MAEEEKDVAGKSTFVAPPETDCKTPEGITVGLVDTIINSLHLLEERDLSSAPVREALKDLSSQPFLRKLIVPNLHLPAPEQKCRHRWARIYDGDGWYCAECGKQMAGEQDEVVTYTKLYERAALFLEDNPQWIAQMDAMYAERPDTANEPSVYIGWLNGFSRLITQVAKGMGMNTIVDYQTVMKAIVNAYGDIQG